MDCGTRKCVECPCLNWNAIDPKYKVLLTPMDRISESELKRALAKSKIPFISLGCSVLLDIPLQRLSDLKAAMWSSVPSLLHSRIKGLFLSNVNKRKLTFRDFLQAEPIPVFFEQAEVEWALQILSMDSLYSVYQPIIDVKVMQIVAYEALVRAHHPYTGEVVSAGELLHACGRLNLMDQLDTMARNCAIRSLEKMERSETLIFINFFPNAIGDPDGSLRCTFEEAKELGVKPERLVFEAVEAESAVSLEMLRETAKYIRSMGAKFALDNLGRGQMAVELIERLNPDYAKMDANLISLAVNGANARLEMDRICMAAQTIGSALIGEGIETIDQMRVALRAGITWMQGFLFSIPCNPEDATKPIRGYLQRQIARDSKAKVTA